MKIYCQLKGSTFCDGQKLLRSIVSGDRAIRPADLLLMRDYSCVQDKNCVEVRYRTGSTDTKIGNVNKENAPAIAACMDNGGTAEISSLNLCGTVDTNIGLYFTVNTSNQRQRNNRNNPGRNH